jgi:hypothetical protein
MASLPGSTTDNLADFVAVRTKFFDDIVREAVASGTRQVHTAALITHIHTHRLKRLYSWPVVETADRIDWRFPVTVCVCVWTWRT